MNVRANAKLGRPFALAAALLFAVSLPSFAESASPLEPWEWSMASRLQVRFDADARRERVRASPLASDPSVVNLIAGATHPELLLPFELWDYLLAAAFDSPILDRDRARESLEKGLPRLAANFEARDFWKALEEIADPFLDLRVALRILRHDAGAHPSRAELDHLHEIEIELCRARIVTLHATRRRFGRLAFDRFLYREVAPRLTLHTHGADELGEDLWYFATGCPDRARAEARRLELISPSDPSEP